MIYKNGNRKIYYVLYGLDYFYGCSFNEQNAFSIYLSCISKHPNTFVYLYENTLKGLILAGYRGCEEKQIIRYTGKKEND